MRVFAFHRPETLREWLDAELHRRDSRPGAPAALTLKGRMRLAPPLNTAGMWPAQIRAVQNLEASFRDGLYPSDRVRRDPLCVAP